ncbi:MAG: hypothetical protein IT209_00150 [Armatimonadetes bacterium]|nr:hypothetical protein [Armatimonadota bacterium]
MKTVRVTVIGLLLVTVLAANARTDALIEKLRAQLARVKDYRCDVILNARLPSFTVSNMRMALYYKRPNKLHVEAKEGFAMLPEEGLYLGDPVEETLRSYNLIRLGDVKWQGRAAVKYALRPKVDSAAPLASARIFVDKARAVPLGFTGASPQFGDVTTVFSYSLVEKKFWLPTKTVFTMKYAPKHSADGRVVESRSGNATLTYSNYKINTNLPDSLFKRPAKSGSSAGPRAGRQGRGRK